MINIKTNNSNFMKIIREKLEKSGLQYKFIPLPEDLSLDTASHVKFHGISMQESAPTLIYSTEKGLIAVQKRSDTKIDLKKLKALVGIKRLNFASINELKQLGIEPGIVPLLGMNLPYYLDQKVLDIKEVYGGSGSKNYTLKINPNDLATVNHATVGAFATSNNETIVAKAGGHNE